MHVLRGAFGLIIKRNFHISRILLALIPIFPYAEQSILTNNVTKDNKKLDQARLSVYDSSS
jgi:hypothetical protein